MHQDFFTLRAPLKKIVSPPDDSYMFVTVHEAWATIASCSFKVSSVGKPSMDYILDLGEKASYETFNRRYEFWVVEVNEDEVVFSVYDLDSFCKSRSLNQSNETNDANERLRALFSSLRRTLLKKYHPDILGGDKDKAHLLFTTANDILIEIEEALEKEF